MKSLPFEAFFEAFMGRTACSSSVAFGTYRASAPRGSDLEGGDQRTFFFRTPRSRYWYVALNHKATLAMFRSGARGPSRRSSTMRVA